MRTEPVSPARSPRVRPPRLLSGLAAALVLFAVPSPCAVGAEPGEAAEISLGGKLYDNHWLASGRQPPSTPNPRYPAEVRTAVGNTWRCVSCHGWDYAGLDGHLGELSRSEAFHSLRAAAGKPVPQLVEAMSAPGHGDNLRGLTAGQVRSLARFVASGQVDVSELVADGRPAGVPLAGKDIYEGACVSCHQADGKAYIQGEHGDRPSLGWIARHRPAQTLHKITNGVPTADMLSLRFLPPSGLADLLAYLRTLDADAD